MSDGVLIGCYRECFTATTSDVITVQLFYNLVYLILIVKCVYEVQRNQIVMLSVIM